MRTRVLSFVITFGLVLTSTVGYAASKGQVLRAAGSNFPGRPTMGESPAAPRSIFTPISNVRSGSGRGGVSYVHRPNYGRLPYYTPYYGYAYGGYQAPESNTTVVVMAPEYTNSGGWSGSGDGYTGGATVVHVVLPKEPVLPGPKWSSSNYQLLETYERSVWRTGKWVKDFCHESWCGTWWQVGKVKYFCGVVAEQLIYPITISGIRLEE